VLIHDARSWAAAVAVCWGLTALSAAEPAAPETRVAAVDVATVFTNYRKVQDVNKQVEGSFEKERKALEEVERKLGEFAREIQQQRQTLPGDSDLLFENVQRFQKEDFQFRKKVQALNEKMEKRMLEEMRDVLREIRAAIRKQAEKGGYHIVMRAPDANDPVDSGELDPPKRDEVNPTQEDIKKVMTPHYTFELVARFRRNPVLYGAGAVDITQAVLETLNKEYEGARRGSAPAVK
jgi:Skp family chaperone for outer membrane proteins